MKFTLFFKSISPSLLFLFGHAEMVFPKYDFYMGMQIILFYFYL